MTRSKRKNNQTLPLDLGPLPIDIIYRVLGLELEEGEVRFSAGAQIHAAKKHPEDYSRYLAFIGGVIASPLYLGDDVRNLGKIEFISRIPKVGGLLVALEVKKDSAGKYNVVSIYSITHEKIEARRRKGRLKACK